MNRPPKIIFVTGTDTDVGKTITTAALAAALGARGRTVAVYKPAQAGTYDGQGDIDVVRRLAGLSDVHEGIRLADAMAPGRGSSVCRGAAPARTSPRRGNTATGGSSRPYPLSRVPADCSSHLTRTARTLADIALATGSLRRGSDRMPRRPRHPQPHRAHHRSPRRRGIAICGLVIDHGRATLPISTPATGTT